MLIKPGFYVAISQRKVFLKESHFRCNNMMFGPIFHQFQVKIVTFHPLWMRFWISRKKHLLKKHLFSDLNLLFLFKSGREKSYPITVLWNGSEKEMRNGGNYANIMWVLPQPSPHWCKNVGRIYSTWIFGPNTRINKNDKRSI